MHSIIRYAIFAILMLTGSNCFPCYIKPQIDHGDLVGDKRLKVITDEIIKRLFQKIYFKPSKNVGKIRIHEAQLVQKGQSFEVRMKISICINGVIKDLIIREKNPKVGDIVQVCVDKILNALISARDSIKTVTLLSDRLKKAKQDAHHQVEEHCFPFGLKVLMKNKSSIEGAGLKGMRNRIIKELYNTIRLQPMERTAEIYIYSSSFTIQKNGKYIWIWLEYSIFVDCIIKDRVFEIKVPLPKDFSRKDFLGKKKLIRQLCLQEICNGLNELKDGG